MTKKHIKRCSVGKCKSKPQWEIIIYPLGWLLSKTNKQKITGVAKDVEKLEPSYIAGGSTVQPLQKAARWCLKKLKTELLYDPAIPFSVQFSSVTQSCPTLFDPMNRSTPGLPVHHQLPEFTQTHIHRVSDAIQPSSVIPFSSSPQSLPASESFPVSQHFVLTTC